MAKKVKELEIPRGLSRILFRLPIALYKSGLGWVLGGRFLLLNHIGRKTGLPRQAVVEVVKHDPATDTYYIAAGFGEKTNWYQNLLKTPEIRIQVGRRKLEVTAAVLPTEPGAEVFVEYAQKYKEAKQLAKFMGYEVDGSMADYREVGEMLKIVALRPRG